jgi:predicted ATPase with chaperone activity
MAATVATVAYLGLEARAVEVQVQLTAGLPRFTIVGLPDKAVAESRERVRAALAAIGLALPPKVITVNLSPADLPKEGSHYHSASMPALVGGGLRVRPGEISLAHLGVLFLDELPKFQRPVLDSLRQPLETGSVSVARANTHVTFPARVQLVAAMNPCRCGHLGDPALACSRGRAVPPTTRRGFRDRCSTASTYMWRCRAFPQRT